MKTLTLTEFQETQVLLALRKRAQVLRGGMRSGRTGEEELFEKLVAVEGLIEELAAQPEPLFKCHYCQGYFPYKIEWRGNSFRCIQCFENKLLKTALRNLGHDGTLEVYGAV